MSSHQLQKNKTHLLCVTDPSDRFKTIQPERHKFSAVKPYNLHHNQTNENITGQSDISFEKPHHRYQQV